MRARIFAATALLSICIPASVFCVENDPNERLNRLDAELGRQSETIRDQQKTIDELKETLKNQKPADAQTTEENAGKLSGLFGGSIMTNPYISVILDAKGYVSNLKNGELNSRGVPGFTNEGRGLRNNFNVDSAEVFIFAPVDPYFNLYVNIPVTDSGTTLEEAYFVTTALPEGFQVKGGRFKSNTSRLNSQHPHAWDFSDIALPYKAFLGSEGVGGENGVQLTWLPPLPVYTLLGIEAFQGDNPLLFGDDPNWAAHAFSAFAKVSIDTSDNSTLYAGPWVLFGSTNSSNILLPDSTSGNLNGDSALYGMETVWKWKEGKQAVTLQGEYLYLVQNGNFLQIDSAGTPTTSPLQRHQDGAYLQALYRYDRWRVGARYDRLQIFDDTFKLADVQQTQSGNPWRATASLEFIPTEFSMIRAQYTHDRSDPGGKVNNEGILQVTFTIGAHPAHSF
jgi:hypothetical protein